MCGALADYAKRVQKREKPRENKDEAVLSTNTDDYVIEDFILEYFYAAMKITENKEE